MSLRKNNLRGEHADLDTGPLSDILFIVLMFFLMISTMSNPNVWRVSTPKGKSDTKQKQTVVVSVDKDRNFYIGATKINKDSLEPALKKMINERDSIKPFVVINADSASQWGEVIKVMRVARKLGATTSAALSGKE